jgi:hypothetical protein
LEASQPKSTPQQPTRSAALREPQGIPGEARTGKSRDDSLALQKRPSHEEKKRVDAEARKRQKAAGARQTRIATIEARIAETEAAIREVEQQMSAPGFYEDRAGAQPVIDRHQALMWEVGNLMSQWEELQSLSDLPTEAQRNRNRITIMLSAGKERLP